MMGQEKKKVLESMSCYIFTKSKYDTTVLHATKKVILHSIKNLWTTYYIDAYMHVIYM